MVPHRSVLHLQRILSRLYRLSPFKRTINHRRKGRQQEAHNIVQPRLRRMGCRGRVGSRAVVAQMRVEVVAHLQDRHQVAAEEGRQAQAIRQLVLVAR